MFYLCICCRLRVSAGFVVFRFRPEVVSRTRGRGKPEVTSPFDSSTSLLYKWSVDRIRLQIKVVFCIGD
jgi:hypothetical protein